MAVGFPAKTNFATGDVLTATNMNDVTGTLNLLESAQYAAGKNKIINGAFDVWQRGTSFSNPTTTTYTADRFMVEHDGSGATRTISQQTFTPGAAPVSGYEAQYYLQYAVTGGTANTFQQVQQRIEDVRTFAGQTVTFSFWAKGDAVRTIQILNNRNFGSGGSTADQSAVGSTLNITTSWARYSVTATLGSVSGKTIGANSFTTWIMRFAAATAQTIQIWGVQLEAASIASPFQTASGTLQGELALCQRYAFNPLFSETALFKPVAIGYSTSTTSSRIGLTMPVTMRVSPSLTVTPGDFSIGYSSGANGLLTNLTVETSSPSNTLLTGTTSGLTANVGYTLYRSTAGTTNLVLSAEL